MADKQIEKMYVITDEQKGETREVIIVQASSTEAADDYVQNVRPRLNTSK